MNKSWGTGVGGLLPQESHQWNHSGTFEKNWKGNLLRLSFQEADELTRLRDNLLESWMVKTFWKEGGWHRLIDQMGFFWRGDVINTQFYIWWPVLVMILMIIHCFTSPVCRFPVSTPTVRVPVVFPRNNLSPWDSKLSRECSIYTKEKSYTKI